MEQYTTLFKALSDETRFRMVILLSDLDLCVTQIQFALGVPQSTVSRHLTVLRNAGLVTDRRDGAWVYYTLAPPKNPVEEALFEVFRECLRTEQSFMADLAKSMVCLDEPRATIAKLLRAGCAARAPGRDE
ncbi:MAG: metalloregulator ArsR/SmtB family transcription factor [Methanospirillum sp.]